MTKTAALYNFFNSFGISAFPSNAVPEDKVYPWLTYENKTDCFGSMPVNIGVNLYYHSDSEIEPNAKAEQISKAIGIGGVTVQCDDGYLWIKRGAPFCQAINDENDSAEKRRFINLLVEYMTL